MDWKRHLAKKIPRHFSCKVRRAGREPWTKDFFPQSKTGRVRNKFSNDVKVKPDFSRTNPDFSRKVRRAGDKKVFIDNVVRERKNGFIAVQRTFFKRRTEWERHFRTPDRVKIEIPKQEYYNGTNFWNAVHRERAFSDARHRDPKIFFLRLHTQWEQFFLPSQ